MLQKDAHKGASVSLADGIVRAIIAQSCTRRKRVDTTGGFMITHPHLAQSLSNKGIVKDRINLIGMLQALQSGLEHHFIRGYLDGDGCIRGAYNPSVTFTGQHDLLKWIRATFHENLDTNPDLGIMNGKGICIINYCGINQARTITTWLYDGATIWMERKRAKIDSWPS